MLKRKATEQPRMCAGPQVQPSFRQSSYNLF